MDSARSSSAGNKAFNSNIANGVVTYLLHLEGMALSAFFENGLFIVNNTGTQFSFAVATKIELVNIFFLYTAIWVSYKGVKPHLGTQD